MMMMTLEKYNNKMDREVELYALSTGLLDLMMITMTTTTRDHFLVTQPIHRHYYESL